MLYTATLCIENKFQTNREQRIVGILSWATVPAAILAASSHARGMKMLLRSFDSSDLPFQTPTLHDRRQFVFPRVVPCLVWLFRVQCTASVNCNEGGGGSTLPWTSNDKRKEKIPSFPVILEKPCPSRGKAAATCSIRWSDPERIVLWTRCRRSDNSQAPFYRHIFPVFVSSSTLGEKRGQLERQEMSMLWNVRYFEERVF